MKRKVKATHKLIKSTAEELAGQFYEVQAAASDVFYSAFPKQKPFVAKHWEQFILPARECLASMLGNATVNEVVKDDIMEALLLDRTLNYKGARTLAA